MKKIMILILLLLVVTGCSAEYNLSIEENIIKETLTLSTEEYDTLLKSDLYSQYQDEYPININDEFLYYEPTKRLEGVKYYDKSLEETTYGYIAKYEGSFTFNNYSNSRILNTAFKNKNIGYNRQEKFYYIYIQDLKIFDYDNSLTSIKVKIDLNDYEIIETNASSSVNNKLEWNFFKNDNNKDSKIIVKYEKKQENEGTTNNGNPGNNNFQNNQNEQNNTQNQKQETKLSDIIIVILAILGFLVAIIFIVVIRKKISHK